MTVSLAKPARIAVQLGIEFLDANVPDWREQIDTAKLDLASCETCVLGQLFSDYKAEEYGVSDGWSNPSGYLRGSWVLHDWIDTHTIYDSNELEFPTVIYGFDTDGTNSYDDLEREWKRVLAS